MSDDPTKNPANEPAKATPLATAVQQRRIPMSTALPKLAVPPLEGYRLYWFAERNISRAIQAGYEFVDDREVSLIQHGVGTDSSISGNADLGSRVRVVAGEGNDRRGEFLTLMKIKIEWYQEDQRAIAERNASVLGQIFRGERILTETGESQADQSLRYVDMSKTSFQRALFQRPARRSR